MPRRQLVPPPQRATWADAYRFSLGFVMIVLGIVILARSWAAQVVTPQAGTPSGVTPPAVLMSLAFVGFGMYRVYVGVVRYRMFRASGRRSRTEGSGSRGR